MSKKNQTLFAKGGYPAIRMRRNRKADWVRRLLAENMLTVNDLVLPLFVHEGKKKKTAIPSMVGIDRLSIDLMLEEAKKAYHLGIPAIALFPAIDPELRNKKASEAYNKDNLIARSIRAVKQEVPEIGVICDVALDPYNSDGHDGVLRNGKVDNDATIEILIRQAIMQAEAGCDVLAPSDMMDGRIGAIRHALEQEGHVNTQLLAYSAKYASSLYGPFREAVGTKQLLQGDKKEYQMNPANSKEALREIALDIEEGADMIMVKPAGFFLDILALAKQEFAIPLFAYQVSGEYSMLQSAAKAGHIEQEAAMMESLLSIKRAGADAIFTYFAMQAAELLR